MPAVRNTEVNSPIIFKLVLALALPVALAVLTGCAQHATTPVDTAQPGVISSVNDDREYHYFTLPNRLRVLAISDPETDKSAASLDIKVGSGDDPADRPGLAHFLEHMLFLGTEKYPVAGEYQEFISSHGGGHNAFTSLEHTNYFFDIDPTYLDEAIDRFAQFFTAPLFNPELVEREKHAVDSEYQSKRKNDGRRQYDVFKTITNPEHPISGFSVGSLETLADQPGASVRDALLEFYEQYYTASLMTLVIIGQEPVDELEQLVRDRFSAIPDTGSATELAPQPLFTPGTLPLWVNIQPVKDIRRLDLQFPVPDVVPHYLAKPASYLGNLLGHEGDGSLLSELKARGLAEGLSAGLGNGGKGFAVFRIGINLTEAGNSQVDEVIALTFNAIDLVTADGVAKWRFEEQASLSELAFNFQEKGAAMHYATRLANAMHDYPYQDVLRAPYAMEEYKPELLQEYLGYLNPANLLVTHVSSGLETDLVGPRFDAPYSSTKIPPSRIARWSEAAAEPQNLQLPEPNPFIPGDLALLDDGSTSDQSPARLIDKPGLELWHKADTSFNTPRANFYFAIRSPVANDTPAHAALAALMVRGVNEQLNEFSYPALLAGLDYQLYKHLRGITVRISGYHDKQDILLENVIDVIRRGEVDPEKFALHKAELIRELGNQGLDTPANQVWGKVSNLLINPSWDEAALLDAVASLDAGDLKAYIPRFLAEIEIVALANGNLDDETALDMAGNLEKVFLDTASAQQVPRSEVSKLEKQSRQLYFFNVEHSDSANLTYFQGDDRTIETRALFLMANQVIKTPFYHRLRTEQQLGYIVQSAAMPILEVPAVGFIVQSPNSSASDVDLHIRNFIAEFMNGLEEMSQEDFERHRKALVVRLTEQDKQLTQRSRRYWHEIDRNNYSFDTREQLVAAVQAIDKQQFIESLGAYLVDDKLRKLTVIAQGQQHAASAEKLAQYRKIEDIRDLQKTGQYFR